MVRGLEQAENRGLARSPGNSVAGAHVRGNSIARPKSPQRDFVPSLPHPELVEGSTARPPRPLPISQFQIPNSKFPVDNQK